jgi:hypothetical protein
VLQGKSFAYIRNAGSSLAQPSGGVALVGSLSSCACLMT